MQHRGPHVRPTPDQGEHANEHEHRRGQTGGKINPVGGRRQQLRQRAGRQQQHRDADQHGQRTPESREYAEQIDVPFHGRRGCGLTTGCDDHVQLDPC